MAWDPAYIAWLRGDTLHPVYLLESIVVGSFGPTSTPLMLSSAYVDDDHVVAISMEGSSIDFGEIRPATWERTYGTLTIGLAGYDPRGQVSRGTVVCLRVGPADEPLSDTMHPHVWLGVVSNVVHRSGRWSIECTEIVGAFTNRWSDAANEQTLFYSLATTTTLEVDFDPEATTEITVVSAVGLETTGDVNARYAVKIEPDDGGEPFFGVFEDLDLPTGVLSTGTFNLFGLEAVAAAAGSTVTFCAYQLAHPMSIAARVLTSQAEQAARVITAGEGAGPNGDYDVLPWGWSYGLPQFLFDAGDMEHFRDRTETGSWRIVVDSKQTDGQQWLTELLRPGGFFLGLHQGAVTVRAIVTPDGRATPGTINIDHDTLIDVVSYDTWDPDSPVEYRGTRVVAADGTADSIAAEASLFTRPSRVSRRRDLPDCWDGTQDWTDDVATRLGRYDTRIPERLSVELRGWGGAIPSIGDFVYLNTSILTRRTIETDPIFRDTECLVVGGGCNWFGATSRLELLVLPRYAGVE